jgi:hypothetical protein
VPLKRKKIKKKKMKKRGKEKGRERGVRGKREIASGRFTAPG